MMNTGNGLLGIINDSNEMAKLNEEVFNKFVKDIFSNNKPEKRYVILELNFIKGYRKQYGDDAFYEFVNTVHIMCGEKTLNYIKEFVAWYELKDSQRSKPKLGKHIK